jgi:hypothetical protein
MNVTPSNSQTYVPTPQICNFPTDQLNPELGMVSCPACHALVIAGQKHPPTDITPEELDRLALGFNPPPDKDLQ